MKLQAFFKKNENIYYYLDVRKRGDKYVHQNTDSKRVNTVKYIE